MIFVSVGGDKMYGFLRLVQEMDEIAGTIQEEVVMQIACTKCTPKHAKFFTYLPYAEYVDFLQKARLIIAHCSAGAVLRTRELLKPLIVFPRQKRYLELFDDHQIEFARAIEAEQIPNITVVYESRHLKESILRVLNIGQQQYVCHDNSSGIIVAVKEFVRTLQK